MIAVRKIKGLVGRGSWIRTNDLQYPKLICTVPALSRCCPALRMFQLHDLQHSFASIGAGSGLGLPVIGKLLGHSNSKTTERYAHLAADPLRRASDAISGAIAKAMGENF